MRQAARRWGVTVFPLAFAVWAGHSSFHFLTGWASIVPVFQQALGRLGLPAGTPDWTLAALVPENLLFPLQVALLYGGYGASAYVAVRAARAQGIWRAAAPLALWFMVVAALTVLILGQPTQMRGTLLGGPR